MQFLEEEVIALTEQLWVSTLGMSPQRVDDLPDRESRDRTRTLDAIVNISGDWQGTVVLQCPRSLGARAAQIMFDLGHAPASLEEVQDALGELINITGGTIKGLMPGSCQLSLPSVIEGADYSIRVPGTRAVTRLVFEWLGEHFIVTLLAVELPHSGAASVPSASPTEAA